MCRSREIAQLFWPRPSGVKKAVSLKATPLECNAATRSERNASAHDFFTLTFARARSYQCEEGVLTTMAAKIPGPQRCAPSLDCPRRQAGRKRSERFGEKSDTRFSGCLTSGGRIY